jgi:hypothetical protein
MQGEIRRTVLASRVKCPSLLTNFNLSCTACNACSGRAMSHISVTWLQCAGRYRQKTVSACRVKCPPLPNDFNLTCTARAACIGTAIWHIWVTPLQCEGRYGGKTVSSSWLEMSPFIPGHRWAARLQLAGRNSLFKWWGDWPPLYCAERATLLLLGYSHTFDNKVMLRIILHSPTHLF